MLPIIWRPRWFSNSRRWFANQCLCSVGLQTIAVICKTLSAFAKKIDVSVTVYMKTPRVCKHAHIQSRVFCKPMPTVCKTLPTVCKTLLSSECLQTVGSVLQTVGSGLQTVGSGLQTVAIVLQTVVIVLQTVSSVLPTVHATRQHDML